HMPNSWPLLETCRSAIVRQSALASPGTNASQLSFASMSRRPLFVLEPLRLRRSAVCDASVSRRIASMVAIGQPALGARGRALALGSARVAPHERRHRDAMHDDRRGD